jgi:hypothetical protein
MAKSSGNKTLNYFDAHETFWTVNSMNSTRNITCSPSSFEGTDPLPGQDKQCFCDDHRTHATEETVSWVKSYWRNIKLEKQARAAEVKIEAEVNALELVALEDSVTAKQASEKE